jgi:hypothetical protein
MFEKIKNKILIYVFNISSQPVLFHELMLANKQFNDGMHLKGINLGFRLRLGRAYLVFLIIAHFFIVPFALIVHALFTGLDCHLSIIMAVLFTAILFAFMGMFKEWLYDEISLKRIQDAWLLHFPHFEYTNNKDIIGKIYNDTISQDIPKKDIERFILDRLVDIN